jgi:tetratricopeptide (TPR) repeat protein
MWFYLAIGAVVSVSFAGLASLTVRRFPQLALIDTDALPQEREAQKKRQILRERVQRRTASKGRWLQRHAIGAAKWFAERFGHLYEGVAQLDKRFWVKATSFIHPAERQRRSAKLVEAAAKLIGDHKLEEAEKKYVAALAVDSKCWAAYRGLGELYMEQKNYAQARETYDFLARMTSRACCGRGRRFQAHNAPAETKRLIAQDHISLALACRAFGDREGWRRALEMAVLHEPANPRNLDLLLEACIMDEDQPRAAAVLQLLYEVNPDNQKLACLEKKVAQIGQKETERVAVEQ